jgi:SCY1-like protein 2
MFTSALKSFSSNITSNYTIASTPSSTSGAWKVFDGKKKSTGKAVSIFVFDRKSLEPQGGSLRSRSNGASRRKIHDEVVERLKKEASSLARLRHPNILELAEPVEDTRSGGLMFATEPITATLAGLLHDQDGRSEDGRGRSGRYKVEDEDGQQKDAEIDELEIQKGLLQVAKGLEFLHESAGLVHGNLTPEAIYINQKSDWKISGLGFSGPPDNSATPSKTFPIALSEILYHDPRLPRNVQLHLDYSSPDFVMDGNVSVSADMFSFGLIILALYNTPHESPIQTHGNVTAYKKVFSSSSTVPTASNNFLCAKPLPRQLLTDLLPRLITRRPAQRMTARDFQQSQFFDNILMSSIRFLESLPAKTPNEKAQFMRGLPRVLDQFPKSVLEKKVLPALLEETKDRELLALILTNVFKIIETLPSAQRSFTDKVLPQLRDIFTSGAVKGNSSERDANKEAGLVIVLDHIRLIADNIPGKVFKEGM